MVDTAFERFVGDIGNPATWPFPVLYKTVSGARPADMICLAPERHAAGSEPVRDKGSEPVRDKGSVFGKFRDAADELIQAGAAGITTSCGFLGLYQPALAAHCSVPVATSALLQLPLVERLLPAGRRAGILTYDAAALGEQHLDAVGAPCDTPIGGIDPQSLFYRWIMQGLPDISRQQLLPDVLRAAEQLQQANPGIGAIVSECTNLTPFATEIRHRTGLPVYDMLTLMHWFHGGLPGHSQAQTAR